MYIMLFCRSSTVVLGQKRTNPREGIETQAMPDRIICLIVRANSQKGTNPREGIETISGVARHRFSYQQSEKDEFP